MTKNWQDRLTETIDFIENTPVGIHDNKRGAIGALLRAANPAQGTSDAMSQGGNFAIRHRATVKDLRSYRRAIILIQTELMGQPVAVARPVVDALADATLPASLNAALGMSYMAAQQPLTTAFNALLGNPANFLANNKVQLYTAPASGTMPHAFYFSAFQNRYVIRPVTPLINDQVFITENICNIHVQPYSTVSGNVGAIPGHRVVGAHLAITTQLTGCSVVYQTDAAATNLVAAHISPTGDPGSAGRGYHLVASLRPAAGFNNGLPAGNVDVFGASQAVGVTNYDPGSVPGQPAFLD